MEGFSTITYKDKSFFYVDYSGFGSDKEKAMQLIKGCTVEYMTHPKNSVVALLNVSGLRFNTEILNTFKSEQEIAAPYEKKIAVTGLNTLQRIAYNIIAGSARNVFIRAFDSEEEAKEWLVSD